MTSLPFSLSSIFRPLPPSLARTRLKYNLFALALSLLLLRGWFPPYTALRGLIVNVGNGLQGRKGREGSWTDSLLYMAETLLALILLFNILEALVAINYPATYAPPQPRGMVMTPSRISSPLTRAYSPSPSPSPATPSQSQSQALYRPSPSGPATTQTQTQTQTPTRSQTAHPLWASSTNAKPASSPLALASSTSSRIFNIPSNANVNASPAKGKAQNTGSGTGLFFDQPAGAGAPGAGGSGGSGATAAAAAGTGGTTGGTGTGTTSEGFVLVDREEKEWIDNVRKGVRGKGARI